MLARFLKWRFERVVILDLRPIPFRVLAAEGTLPLETYAVEIGPEGCLGENTFDDDGREEEQEFAAVANYSEWATKTYEIAMRPLIKSMVTPEITTFSGPFNAAIATRSR